MTVMDNDDDDDDQDYCAAADDDDSMIKWKWQYPSGCLYLDVKHEKWWRL